MKKNQMEISKIKNIINEKIKKQQMGSIAEWRRQGKELEERTIQMTNSEKHRKID